MSKKKNDFSCKPSCKVWNEYTFTPDQVYNSSPRQKNRISEEKYASLPSQKDQVSQMQGSSPIQRDARISAEHPPPKESLGKSYVDEDAPKESVKEDAIGPKSLSALLQTTTFQAESCDVIANIICTPRRPCDIFSPAYAHPLDYVNPCNTPRTLGLPTLDSGFWLTKSTGRPTCSLDRRYSSSPGQQYQVAHTDASSPYQQYRVTQHKAAASPSQQNEAALKNASSNNSPNKVSEVDGVSPTGQQQMGADDKGIGAGPVVSKERIHGSDEAKTAQKIETNVLKPNRETTPKDQARMEQLQRRTSLADRDDDVICDPCWPNDITCCFDFGPMDSTNPLYSPMILGVPATDPCLTSTSQASIASSDMAYSSTRYNGSNMMNFDSSPMSVNPNVSELANCQFHPSPEVIPANMSYGSPMDEWAMISGRRDSIFKPRKTNSMAVISGRKERVFMKEQEQQMLSEKAAGDGLRTVTGSCCAGVPGLNPLMQSLGRSSDLVGGIRRQAGPNYSGKNSYGSVEHQEVLSEIVKSGAARHMGVEVPLMRRLSPIPHGTMTENGDSLDECESCGQQLNAIDGSCYNCTNATLSIPSSPVDDRRRPAFGRVDQRGEPFEDDTEYRSFTSLRPATRSNLSQRATFTRDVQGTRPFERVEFEQAIKEFVDGIGKGTDMLSQMLREMKCHNISEHIPEVGNKPKWVSTLGRFFGVKKKATTAVQTEGNALAIPSSGPVRGFARTEPTTRAGAGHSDAESSEESSAVTTSHSTSQEFTIIYEGSHGEGSSGGKWKKAAKSPSKPLSGRTRLHADRKPSNKRSGSRSETDSLISTCTESQKRRGKCHALSSKLEKRLHMRYRKAERKKAGSKKVERSAKEKSKEKKKVQSVVSFNDEETSNSHSQTAETRHQKVADCSEERRCKPVCIPCYSPLYSLRKRTEFQNVGNSSADRTNNKPICSPHFSDKARETKKTRLQSAKHSSNENKTGQVDVHCVTSKDKRTELWLKNALEATTDARGVYSTSSLADSLSQSQVSEISSIFKSETSLTANDDHDPLPTVVVTRPSRRPIKLPYESAMAGLSTQPKSEQHKQGCSSPSHHSKRFSSESLDRANERARLHGQGGRDSKKAGHRNRSGNRPVSPASGNSRIQQPTLVGKASGESVRHYEKTEPSNKEERGHAKAVHSVKSVRGITRVEPASQAGAGYLEAEPSGETVELIPKRSTSQGLTIIYEGSNDESSSGGGLKKAAITSSKTLSSETSLYYADFKQSKRSQLEVETGSVIRTCTKSQMRLGKCHNLSSKLDKRLHMKDRKFENEETRSKETDEGSKEKKKAMKKVSLLYTSKDEEMAESQFQYHDACTSQKDANGRVNAPPVSALSSVKMCETAVVTQHQKVVDSSEERRCAPVCAACYSPRYSLRTQTGFQNTDNSSTDRRNNMPVSGTACSQYLCVKTCETRGNEQQSMGKSAKEKRNEKVGHQRPKHTEKRVENTSEGKGYLQVVHSTNSVASSQSESQVSESLSMVKSELMMTAKGDRVPTVLVSRPSCPSVEMPYENAKVKRSAPDTFQKGKHGHLNSVRRYLMVPEKTTNASFQSVDGGSRENRRGLIRRPIHHSSSSMLTDEPEVVWRIVDYISNKKSRSQVGTLCQRSSTKVEATKEMCQVADDSLTVKSISQVGKIEEKGEEIRLQTVADSSKDQIHSQAKVPRCTLVCLNKTDKMGRICLRNCAAAETRTQLQKTEDEDATVPNVGVTRQHTKAELPQYRANTVIPETGEHKAMFTKQGLSSRFSSAGTDREPENWTRLFPSASGQQSIDDTQARSVDSEQTEVNGQGQKVRRNLIQTTTTSQRSLNAESSSNSFGTPRNESSESGRQNRNLNSSAFPIFSMRGTASEASSQPSNLLSNEGEELLEASGSASQGLSNRDQQSTGSKPKNAMQLNLGKTNSSTMKSRFSACGKMTSGSEIRFAVPSFTRPGVSLYSALNPDQDRGVSMRPIQSAWRFNRSSGER